MIANPEANLLVFRETKTRISAEELVQALCQRVAGGLDTRQAVLDALIRSGELECALFDADVPGVKAMVELTDQLADLLIIPGEENSAAVHTALAGIRNLALPKTLQV